MAEFSAAPLIGSERAAQLVSASGETLAADASPLAARLQASPKVQALAQLRKALNDGPAVQRQQGLSAILNGRGTVQRHQGLTYGALNNDCGTSMSVVIEGQRDADVGNGSSPSVEPSWWPRSAPHSQSVINFASKYLVQGHLLNEHLGGPGNTMDNLTPITKSTNSQHNKKVEQYVKKLVNDDCDVQYDVSADFSAHPDAVEFGLSAGDQAFVDNFSDKIVAGYTATDPTTGNVVAQDQWEIKNEGAAMKGVF